jgi:RND superfamily putative drug exporter
LAVLAVLVAFAAAAAGTHMSYDQGGGPSTPATRTAATIAAGLTAGAGDPQQVYVQASGAPLSAARLEPLRKDLARVDGVSAVARPVLAPDRRGARIDVVLRQAPLSAAAMDLVHGPMRDAARHAAPAGTRTMVTGTAATNADVRDSVSRDMQRIYPLAAGLILLILVFTLRSAVAPLYLLAAVVLEFAATLGATVLVFQHLAGADGVSFVLPLTMFLFVVALGTDYNILMTARLREEMLAGRPIREAVAEAVRRVAPAVGAAGLVLASSFATLGLEADDTTRQQGFAMAFGILLASLVVSSVLVPALTAVVGGRAWWPVRKAGDRRATARPGKAAAQPAR